MEDGSDPPESAGTMSQDSGETNDAIFANFAEDEMLNLGFIERDIEHKSKKRRFL